MPEPARADGAALVEALAAAAAQTAPGVQAGLLREALAPFVRRRYPDAEPRLHDLGLLTDSAANAGQPVAPAVVGVQIHEQETVAVDALWR